MKTYHMRSGRLLHVSSSRRRYLYRSRARLISRSRDASESRSLERSIPYWRSDLLSVSLEIGIPTHKPLVKPVQQVINMKSSDVHLDVREQQEVLMIGCFCEEQ